jgi:hypothetical protein
MEKDELEVLKELYTQARRYPPTEDMRLALIDAADVLVKNGLMTETAYTAEMLVLAGVEFAPTDIVPAPMPPITRGRKMAPSGV